MAYIVDYAITENAAGGATSVSANVPPHEADDYLVVFSSVNGTAGGTSGNTNSGITVSGWTQIGTFLTANTGISTSVYYLKCASSSETCTVAITTADDYTIKVICIRDADTTNFLDSGTVISTTNTSTASKWSSPTMSTNQNDSLVMYCHGYDGSQPALHTDPGTMFYISSDSTGTTAQTSAAGAVAWYIQRTAGTTPGPSWTCSVGDDRTNHVFAIRNKSGGRIPAYIDDANTTAATVMMGHHFSTLNNLTFAGALTIANIGPSGSGKTATLDAAAAAADYGLNPYSSALSSTPAATAATGVAGFEVTLTNTIDMSSGFLVGTIVALNPKMANYIHGNITQGGTYIVLASGTTANTDYASYQVAARDSDPNTGKRMVFSVQPSQTTTAYGTNGSFSASAVKRLMFLSNNPTATITLYTAEWFHVTKIACAGGDSSNPVDTEGLAAIGSSFRIPLFERSGAAGILCFVPIQIGGGDAINFQIDAGALQFPRIYSTTKKQINFHANGSSAIGISYAGKSGDVIKHTNSVVTSPSPYYWEINSAATSAATWDFSGLVIVGAVVTLRNVMTFDGMSFVSCISITASGCTIINAAISNLPAGNDTLTTNGSTVISSSAINVTGVTAGNRWCSVANPTIFSGCVFTGSGSSGHAIRITTAGTYNLSGNTFNSFGADGSTSAAIYNDSGGSVTLNIVGGGNSPTYRNGAGASTTVNLNVTLTINITDSDGTAISQNCEVTVVKVSDESVLFHEDNITDGSTAYSFNSGGGTAVYINVLNVTGYQNKTVYLNLPTSDTTTIVALDTDRIYTNP
ncbi:MAG: hypothetical protein HYV90_05720 [Candidatus Woesebacteria bacterium]|nr:MAG: hypothetical protein HYV90_05720 [Candidatus Woesebacteria bacterium]